MRCSTGDSRCTSWASCTFAAATWMAAEASFRAAEEAASSAQPGLALVELAAGNVAAAAAMISGALQDARAPLRRVLLLPAQVEIAIAVGDLDAGTGRGRRIGRDQPAVPDAGAGRGERRGRRRPRAGHWVGRPRGDRPAARSAAMAEGGSAVRGGPGTAHPRPRTPCAGGRRVGHHRAPRGRRCLRASRRGDAGPHRRRPPAPGGAGAGERRCSRTGQRDICVHRHRRLDRDDRLDRRRRLGDDAPVARRHPAVDLHHPRRERDRPRGDGFFVAFADVSAAAACAVDIQRSFENHRRVNGFAPQVRIGMHTAAVVVAHGDYQGAGVHVAARIGAAAAGGEILASAHTAVAAGRSMATPGR